jgi:NADH-quinone oxidoreductase subunit E
MLETTPENFVYLSLLILASCIVIYFNSKSSKDKNCQETPTSDNPMHINNINKKDSTLKKSVATLMDTSFSESKQPILLAKARDGGKDNLQLIKGIGKVLEKLLNDMGIYHFDQIANWTKEEVNWLDKSLSFPGRIKRENWVEQAKILASGETTEFAQRVERGEVATSKKS